MNFRALVVLLTLSGFYLHWRWVPPSLARDVYRNFSELQKAHREGNDFEVTVRDLNAKWTVFAIHGGTIERGTELLAKSLAPIRTNLYVFESRLCPNLRVDEFSRSLCVPGTAGNLHLTSHHFDDPRAVKLAEKSRQCMSLHGFRSSKKALEVMIGGLSSNLKARASVAFRQFVPEVVMIPPSTTLGGTHPQNIVNRCLEQGVQIELSGPVRVKVVQNRAFRERFLRALEAVFFAGDEGVHSDASRLPSGSGGESR